MYQVQMQFIPRYNNIWVTQLNPEDTSWEFELEADAIAKAEELQAADPSGRQYRSYTPPIDGTPVTETIIEMPIIEETPVVEETPIVETPTEETPTV